MNYKAGSKADWPGGMEEICSNCAARGVEPTIAGTPTPDAKCENQSSTRHQERVGYQGSGCEKFVYPHRS